MRLTPVLVPDWPKLAWVATVSDGADEVRVLHGPMVETADEWIVEAVWAGDFVAGDFDKTDLVFGSGVRLRDGEVVFVSSGTVFDSLVHCTQRGVTYVSNSLAALLASAELTLLPDYDYPRDIDRTIKGLDFARAELPTRDGDIVCCRYLNLVYRHGQIQCRDKADVAPHFLNYVDYYTFLCRTSQSLFHNATAPDRTHSIAGLTTVSSGYDSPAVSVIAMRGGCDHAVTIRESNSYWRGTDSGEHIARSLGLNCSSHALRPENIEHEVAVWAALGRSGELNWTGFGFPEPLCLLFTGFHGDAVWDRKATHSKDPFFRPDPAGLGLGEFRLWRGVYHCNVPFWGIRRAQEIRSISQSKEMRAWSVGDSYDRPIPRRIVEEAGLNRGTFATLKKDASSEMSFSWPVSRGAREAFRQYLKKQHVFVPPEILIRPIQVVAHLDTLWYKNVLKRFGRRKGSRPWSNLAQPSSLFCWANEELQEKYQRALLAG